MGEAAIEAFTSLACPDSFEISIVGIPKPNGRLEAQVKLAYPNFNT